MTHMFEQLLAMALTALPVMAVVLAARWLLRGAPKQYTYLLWLVVAFRLICPVAPESPVGLVQPGETAQQISEAADSYIEPTLTYRDNGGFTPDYDVLLDRGYTPNAAGEIITNEAGTREALQGEDIFTAAAALWLLGMAAMTGYLIFSTLRLKRQVATAVRREDNIWECDGIPTPFVLGLLRPRIYLPFRMTEDQRTYILAHERYHIRHGDPWAKLLGLAILTVYWWNPAVWLCWVLFCRDMEMRCDEAVLARLGDGVKKEYSLSLLSFALDRRAPMALAFGEHDAAKRIKNVLKWKKAAPAVVFLAAAAALLVVLICGTNAQSGKENRVTLRSSPSGGMEFDVEVTEDIHSWCLYRDIYHNGRLISSGQTVLDGFADENSGVSTRDFTGRLYVESEHDSEGGFTNQLAWSVTTFGTGGFTETLPERRYTGAVHVIGEGEEKTYRLNPDEDILLYTVLLSTEPEGKTTTYAADRPLTQVNNTVVRYRLLLSSGTIADLPVPQLDLAQALFDLRLTTLKSSDDAKPLLEKLGVGGLGGYEIKTFEENGDKVLLVAYDRVLTSEEELEMANIATILLALIQDVTRVDFSYYEKTTGNLCTVYCNRKQPDSWAENMGYADIKALGQTAAGIRALMQYLGMDIVSDASTAAALFVRAQRLDDMALMQYLLGADLWGSPITQPATVGWPGNFGPSVSFYETPADADALDTAMARRAALLMMLRPEVGYVLWSYPGKDGETANRDLHSTELGMLLSLSSDLRVFDETKTAEDLERKIRFLNLDEKLFLRFSEEGSAFTPDRIAEQSAVWFTPEDIHDIEYAALEWWDGQRFYPLTGEGYAYIEERFGSATEIGASGCPFQSAVLYLHRADGVVGKVIPAGDSCDIFLSDGKYYQFGNRAQPPYTDNNSTLFAHFGTSVEELPHYTVSSTEPVVFANILLKRDAVGTQLDARVPSDMYFDLDTWEDGSVEELGGYVYYKGLTRAEFRQFVEGLDIVPTELQEIELEGDETDLADIAVSGTWTRAEIQQLTAAMGVTLPAVKTAAPQETPPAEEPEQEDVPSTPSAPAGYQLPLAFRAESADAAKAEVERLMAHWPLKNGGTNLRGYHFTHYKNDENLYAGFGITPDGAVYTLPYPAVPLEKVERTFDVNTMTYTLTVRIGENTPPPEGMALPPAAGTYTYTISLPAFTCVESFSPAEGTEGRIAFGDILGFSGYTVTETGAGSGHTIRTYYTIQGGGPMKIAETFGYGAPQDYGVDLDGDGVNELVANVTYGGDGARRAYVYQRRGNDVYLGTLSTAGLPNFDDWGANAYWSEYDSAEQVFRIHYAQKNSEEYGVLETKDLSRFQFTKFTP